nr:ATPase H transporting lysosomal 13 kDa V1 [Hymenolepis microstoma]
MSTTNSLDGPGQLQIAKAAALSKVEDARIRRLNKIREAQTEAAILTRHFKEEHEKHYNEVVKEFALEDARSTERFSTLAEKAIEKLHQMYEENKEKALADLIVQVLNIKPTVHRNAMNIL